MHLADKLCKHCRWVHALAYHRLHNHCIIIALQAMYHIWGAICVKIVLFIYIVVVCRVVEHQHHWHMKKNRGIQYGTCSVLALYPGSVPVKLLVMMQLYTHRSPLITLERAVWLSCRSHVDSSRVQVASTISQGVLSILNNKTSLKKKSRFINMLPIYKYGPSIYNYELPIYKCRHRFINIYSGFINRAVDL